VATTDGGTLRRPLAERQVIEHLIGKQPVTLAVQQRIDRVLRQRPVTETIHVIEHTGLAFRHPHTHRPPLNQNPMHVILANKGDKREHLRQRKTPAT
jgi:hypothetical protein